MVVVIKTMQQSTIQKREREQEQERATEREREEREMAPISDKNNATINHSW